MIRHAATRQAARAAALLSVFAMIACHSTSGHAPTDDARTEALAVGGAEVSPAGSALGVSLLAVENDSRCPRSVQCVRLGDATIRLGVRLGMGPTVPMSLRWGAPPSDTVVGGVRLVFDSLTPWPATPDPIPSSAYRAWISLRRVAP